MSQVQNKIFQYGVYQKFFVSYNRALYPRVVIACYSWYGWAYFCYNDDCHVTCQGHSFNFKGWLASYFSLKYHCRIKQQGLENKEKWSPTREVHDRLTNSPCQHHRKCKENSMENMDTHVRCKGLSCKFVFFLMLSGQRRLVL